MHSGGDESRDSGLAEGLAPVIPLFGPGGSHGSAREASSPPAPPGEHAVWRSTWEDEPTSVHVMPEREEPSEVDAERVAESAEKTLLKKLRTRSLSVSEARGVLSAGGMNAAAADELIERFESRGYLDDAALAEQLVHVGLDRKGQGRRVIAQTLAKRGVPRPVADAALLALPDDDRERALDFARSKVRSVASVDRDAALRRLVGQLARRGYGGSLALGVAKQALDESTPAHRGVRFD
jgi:regulatory protein